MSVSGLLSRLLVLAAFLVAFSGAAQAGEFLVATDSGAKVWADYVARGETVIWSGAADAEGYATGPGTMKFLVYGKPVQTYQGDMRRGFCHGFGRFSFLSSGSTYEGEFADGKYQGKGLYTENDGSYYDGHWFAGRRNGRGNARWTDGRLYEGEWLDGKQGGPGIMTWPSGIVFVGEWLEGEPLKGVMTSPGGERYEGDFFNGVRHGKGVMTWPNGDSYTGEFQRARITGKGLWRFFNGYYFEGEFEKGEFHGAGTLYAADGRVLQQGRWAEGKFAGAAASQEVSR